MIVGAIRGRPKAAPHQAATQPEPIVTPEPEPEATPQPSFVAEEPASVEEPWEPPAETAPTEPA
jgi:hypothetical protein